MSTPALPGIERLAWVLSDSRDEIMSEWRLYVNELLLGLGLDQPTITDHLPTIVQEILDDLVHHGVAPADRSASSPPRHGVQRVYDGLDVGEVVAEYNLLRVAFITVSERHGHYVVGDAMRIINHRIDEAVRQAVVAFAEREAEIRKEKDDQHLAFIAHDLRTPLNAVSLVVEEMKDGLSAAALAEAADLFEVLRRNLQNVEALIKRVLDTAMHPSQISPSLRLERRTFELWPLVQRSVSDLRPLAAKHAIKVTNLIPRTLTVFADAFLISQVFQNLLGNAFKYCAHGQVVVSATEEGDLVTCVVQDNGAGIPADLLARVFDKGVTDPDKDGTGLGLVIVKQIVEAHGGTASAASDPGEGTVLRFSLPAGTRV